MVDLATLKEWWSKPFDPGMNTVHWFYFLGLLIALSGAWGMILRYVTRDASTGNA